MPQIILEGQLRKSEILIAIAIFIINLFFQTVCGWYTLPHISHVRPLSVRNYRLPLKLCQMENINGFVVSTVVSSSCYHTPSICCTRNQDSLSCLFYKSILPPLTDSDKSCFPYAMQPVCILSWQLSPARLIDLVQTAPFLG